MDKIFWTDGETILIENYNKDNDLHYGYVLNYMGDDKNLEPIYEKGDAIKLTTNELKKYHD